MSPKRFEFISGLITLLLGLVNGTIVLWEGRQVEWWFVSVWICSAILVALGAYAHGLRGRRWGFVVLLLGGGALGLFFIWDLLFFEELLYASGMSGIAFLLLGAMGIITLISSIVPARQT
jgi:hypothetical protein